MDFSLSQEIVDLPQRTRRLVAERIIPLEGDPRCTAHGPTEELRNELVSMARSAGLLTPHASHDMGGMALSHVAKAAVFEEAGYSPLAPTAINVHAPDEGNIHLMEAAASTAQKERWLRPQVQGRTRSCFAMTEPAPGAGAAPSMLMTTAVREGSDYVINGAQGPPPGGIGLGHGTTREVTVRCLRSWRQMQVYLNHAKDSRVKSVACRAENFPGRIR